MKAERSPSLEEGSRVPACAGLWDKGANVRERWRLKSTGDEKIIETTALTFGDDFQQLPEPDRAMTRPLSDLRYW